jgi:hypothetical protein
MNELIDACPCCALFFSMCQKSKETQFHFSGYEKETLTPPPVVGCCAEENTETHKPTGSRTQKREIQPTNKEGRKKGRKER